MVKKFAVFDIDGTLIRWQLYHAVADQLAKNGHFPEEQWQAVKAARMTWKKRESEDSFLRYEHELVSLVDAAITDVAVEDVMAASRAVIEEYKDQVYTYTRDLIQQLRSQNYLLFAISASQASIVKLLAEYYGFDDYGGSEYAVQDGRFTGQKEVLMSGRKPEFLKQLVQKHGADYAGSLGVGDSESDIPMLSTVERPIAFNPTKKLFEHARASGWQIVVERKNVVYHLEHRDDEHWLLV